MVRLFYILFILTSQLSFSQSSIYNEVGKNRIQFKSFNWEVLFTNNFEIYYNSDSRKIAETASSHLESNFSQLTTNIGHQPFQKTKVFIYNSDKDLDQSNIGINETNRYLNSNSNFNNRTIFKVSYSDNLKKFKEKLNYEFTKILINDLMNGNMSFAKRFGKVSFINIPNWFSDGAARYTAYGWDIKMDNIIRDYFLTEDKKSINKITERESGFIGQSIWNYISIVYGKNTISNIINLAKIIRNPERAISSSLGISFENFINEWSKYYFHRISSNFNRDDNDVLRIGFNKKNIGRIIDLKYNTSKDQLAVTTLKRNLKKILIYDINSEKLKIVDKIKDNSNKESYYITWKNNEEIAYLKSIKGKNFIISNNTNSNKKEYKSLEKFDIVNGFSYNSNESLIAVSGSIKNQKDIYLLSANSSNMKKITDDIYDDIYPSFFKNSTSIAFSSNRSNSKLDQENSSSDKNDSYNLFIHNLDTTSNELFQLTNEINDNIKIKTLSNNDVIYISDKKGIFNLYNHNIYSNSLQITDFDTNILNFDYDEKEKKLIFNSLYNGEIIVREIKNFNINQSKFGNQTARVDYIQIQKSLEKNIAIKRKDEKKENINFESTDNFNFEDENSIKSSILKNIERNKKPSNNLGSKYRYSFVKNNFNSFLEIDPLEGLGSIIETDFIELFENHKLYARSFLPLSSLKSTDIFTEYSYLKHRFDFRVSFDRKILYAEDSERYIYHKYLFNRINLNISYPISKFSRFEISPFIATHKFNDLDYRIFNNTPPPFTYYEKDNFYGYFFNFKFDNIKSVSSNLEEGSRINLSFKNYVSTNNKDKSFKNLTFNVSHHQRISENLFFASKIFYGNSFGNNPFKYFLGGVKNSLSNTSEDKGINDPLRVVNGNNNNNFIFGEYINLRGYNFNKFDGHKVLTLNSELRIPLLKFISGKSLSSSFLNSLQLVGFFDLGSSWNVNSPFSKNNDVNTWIIKEPGSVFQAEIENSKNPWLASYGFGLRSFITDYYIKLDIAKPIEDYQIGNTKYHISFGYSF